MTRDEILREIRRAFAEEAVAMNQEYDAVAEKNHQDAAACHERRRSALNRVGALMEKL